MDEKIKTYILKSIESECDKATRKNTYWYRNNAFAKIQVKF